MFSENFDDKEKREHLEKADKLETYLEAVSGGAYYVLDHRKLYNQLNTEGQVVAEYPEGVEGVRGYQVLHKVNIDQETTRKLLSNLIDSLREFPKSAWMCFSPRQGMKVFAATEEIEFIICEECGSVHYKGKDWGDSALLGPQPLGAFASLLEQSNLTLPE